MAGQIDNGVSITAIQHLIRKAADKPVLLNILNTIVSDINSVKAINSQISSLDICRPFLSDHNGHLL